MDKPAGPSPHQLLMSELNLQRQDKGMKWVEVAHSLNITYSHLHRIRKGESPVSDDVAYAIDKFLERDRGYTLNMVRAPSGVTDLTDAEISAMSPNDLETYAKRYGHERGVDALHEFVVRVRALQQEKLDSLLADPE